MNLKKLLENKNYNFVTFSEKVNLSVSTISYYNSKKRSPKIKTMQKMAEILDVDLQTVVNCFVKDKEKTQKE